MIAQGDMMFSHLAFTAHKMKKAWSYSNDLENLVLF